jgi:hypothetical protein
MHITYTGIIVPPSHHAFSRSFLGLGDCDCYVSSACLLGERNGDVPFVPPAKRRARRLG